MRNHDEVALSSMIEKARVLGTMYPWQSELDQAEEFLYEITCFEGREECKE